MRTDRTELNDLSTQFPEKVAAMSEEYAAWAKRCFVNRKSAK